MKQLSSILLLLTAIVLQLYAEVNISDKNRSIIHTSALTVLKNYESTINMIGEFVVFDVEP